MSKQIFISHSVADKGIAEKVVDLLGLGMAINVAEDVFCSSLEGLKCPPGENFVDYIRDQIQNPKIVILLISQNYLASQFCLAEIGACWAMFHKTIPFLISPVRYEDMKAVISNIAALKIEDESNWNEALEEIKKTLNINPNHTRWERKRDEYILVIKDLIAKQPSPVVVSIKKFDAINRRLHDANEEITELRKQNTDLTNINNKLIATKDREDVDRVIFENLPDREKFEKLVANATAELGKLPKIVSEVIYHKFSGHEMGWPNSNEEAEIEKITDSIQREYITDMNVYLLPNTRSPKVSRAISAIEELKKFINEDSSPQFASFYEKEYDEVLSFESKTFWEAHLL